MYREHEDKHLIRVTTAVWDNIEIDLPWDADLEKWLDAWKVILYHGTFPMDTIDKLMIEWDDAYIKSVEKNKLEVEEEDY